MSNEEKDIATMEAMHAEIVMRRIELDAKAKQYVPGSDEMFEFVRQEDAKNEAFIKRLRNIVRDIAARNPFPGKRLLMHLNGARGWLAAEDRVRPQLKALFDEHDARRFRPTQALGVA